MTWRTESSSTCDECRRFYSNRGLLVRAFECDVSSGWVGWNVELGNRFVSQRDGMRLLTDPSADELARFQGCGLSELKLGPRDEGPAHTVQGRANVNSTRRHHRPLQPHIRIQLRPHALSQDDDSRRVRL